MRTQGWWLNVATKNERGSYSHYCSIWLGDNRGGKEEKRKANFLKLQIAHETGCEWNFTLSEEWITRQEHTLD